jgi:hypothetical protein
MMKTSSPLPTPVMMKITVNTVTEKKSLVPWMQSRGFSRTGYCITTRFGPLATLSNKLFYMASKIYLIYNRHDLQLHIYELHITDVMLVEMEFKQVMLSSFHKNRQTTFLN